jgi:DNA-binding NtrC family response regulator
MTDNTAKHLVVYVDDEEMNLKLFEAAAPDRWEVKCFNNAKDALDFISKVEPAVVVSDQRMPELTGLDFLQRVLIKRPETTRMVVTAYSERHVILDLLRKAEIFDFITKPWEQDLIVSQVGLAIEEYTKKVEIKKGQIPKLRELIDKTEEIIRSSKQRIEEIDETLKKDRPKK